ncbi:MAG: hypothetical protein RIT35_317, partial [Pseudomonadota bacterium]
SIPNIQIDHITFKENIIGSAPITLKIQGNIAIKLVKNDIKLLSDGNINLLQSPITSTLPQLSKKSISWQLDANYNPYSLEYKVNQLLVAAPGIEINSNLWGDLAKKSFTAKSKIDILSLTELNDKFKGQATILTEFNYNDLHNKLIIQSHFNDLQGHGVTYQKVAISAIVQDVLSNPSGNLEVILDGSVPLSAKTNFTYHNNVTHMDKIEVTIPQGNMHGNLLFNHTNKLLLGSLESKLNNISFLESALNKKLAGEIHTKIDFVSKDLKTQQAKVEIQGKHIEYANMVINKFNLNLASQDLWNAKNMNAIINVADFTGKNFLFNKLSVKASGNLQQAEFLLDVTGSLPQKFHFNTKARLQQTLKDLYIFSINHLDGNYNNIVIRQQEPSSMLIKQNQINFNVAGLQLADGVVKLSGTIKENILNFTSKLNHVPLKVIPIKLPNFLEHSLASGNINITGNTKEPKIISNIELQHIGISTFAPLYLAHIKAQLSNQKLTCDLNMQGKGIEKLSIQMNSPLSMSLMPFKTPTFNLNKTKWAAQVNLNVKPISNALLSSSNILDGKVIGQFSVSGGLNKPKLIGHLSISEGKYQSIPWNLSLPHISGKLDASGHSILSSLTILDESTGIIEGSGRLSLDTSLPSIYMILNSKDFNLSSRTKGKINGKITIAGNSKNILVSGQLSSKRLEIHIPERFAENIPELNIVSTNSTGKASPHSVIAQASFLENINLKITWSAKNQVFIRGWGIDGELGGNLVMMGHANNPQVFGNLKLIRGRYQEFGKTFKLVEGTLNFDGPIPPSPFINLIASTKIQATEIRPIISGPLITPTINITSNPPSSQADAMSLLLFGQGVKSISVLQTIQLAETLNKLTIGSQGNSLFAPLETIHKLMGIDHLEISEDKEKKNYTLGIGKYIGDKIYLKLEGNQNNTAKAKIEIEVTPNITIENETQQDSTSKTGIYCKYNY